MLCVARKSVWMWTFVFVGAASSASRTAFALGLVDEALPHTLRPIVVSVSVLCQAAPMIGSARLFLLAASDPSVKKVKVGLPLELPVLEAVSAMVVRKEFLASFHLSM